MQSSISHEMVESAQSPLPAGFLAQLPERFAQEGQTIYQGRNEIKLFYLNGRPVCVKKYGVPPFFNRVLYSWGLRTPKAKRSYQNAAEILARGFKTPVQWGYLITRQNGLIGPSYGVGEFIENARDVGQDRQDKALIRAFARFTADLHFHGLMHRDYILNNILYTQEADQYHFTLIDINRFVFRDKPISGFLQSVNLMQSFHDYGELRAFVEQYIQAAHTSDALCKRVLFFRWVRNRYSELKRLLKKIPGAKRLCEYKR